MTVFGRTARTCARFLCKGRKVCVQGRPHHSEWQTDSGRRQKLEVIADNVEFLDSRRDEAQAGAEMPAAA